MTMPKKDTTNALDDALFAANELLSIQAAADWPDSKPISNGLDDLTFGHLRVLRDAALTQSVGQNGSFNIGDMVQISPNYPYYEDWKGAHLEIVGIYRDSGSKYQSPNTPPPIRYSVKDVKDSWTYGYTDDFSFDDLIASPVSVKEG
jgi:hypothetical protein